MVEDRDLDQAIKNELSECSEHTAANGVLYYACDTMYSYTIPIINTGRTRLYGA
jgi:hypothetical protein